MPILHFSISAMLHYLNNTSRVITHLFSLYCSLADWLDCSTDDSRSLSHFSSGIRPTPAGVLLSTLLQSCSLAIHADLPQVTYRFDKATATCQFSLPFLFSRFRNQPIIVLVLMICFRNVTTELRSRREKPMKQGSTPNLAGIIAENIG